MSLQSADILERLLQDAGYEFMIGPDEYKVKLLRVRIEQLEKVTAAYRRLLPDQDAVNFSPEALAAEAERNPHKVRAFLQAFAGPGTAEMLVMAWRILQGLRIRKVEMEYEEEKKFSLTIVLARPGDGQEEYKSDDIWDAALVGQFGSCKVNGGPVFLGFNPLRTKE